jgi:hypothetical protein
VFICFTCIHSPSSTATFFTYTCTNAAHTRCGSATSMPCPACSESMTIALWFELQVAMLHAPLGPPEAAPKTSSTPMQKILQECRACHVWQALPCSAPQRTIRVLSNPSGTDAQPINGPRICKCCILRITNCQSTSSQGKNGDCD